MSSIARYIMYIKSTPTLLLLMLKVPLNDLALLKIPINPKFKITADDRGITDEAARLNV